MKKIITFIFLQYCLFGLDLENISFQKKWNILQNNPVRIEWLYHEGFPIIRASKVCDHSMHSLAVCVYSYLTLSLSLSRIHADSLSFEDIAIYTNEERQGIITVFIN